MHLYTHCKSCFKEITISSSAKDRFKLAKEVGEIIPANCMHCGKRNEVHVNDVKAEESKYTSIIAALILLIGTPLLLIYQWDYILQTTSILYKAGAASLLVIPFMFYQAIKSSQSAKTQYFNSKNYG